MDNFRFLIQNDCCLIEAVQVAFSHQKKATHYRVSDEKGLILYWAESKREGVKELPYPLSVSSAVDFITNWLASDAVPRQQNLDHDGDNGKGYRIYNEAWGHVDGEWQAFVAIQPIHAWYGK